jgi:iron(III) transport system permease protein
VVIIAGLGLHFVERELEEAAELEGSLGQVLLHVTLPRALPAILAAALWVFVAAAGEITVTDLYQVRTFAEEIYVQLPLMDDLGSTPRFTSLGVLSPGYAMLALLAAAALLAARRMASTSALPSPGERRVIPLRRWKWCATLAYGVALLFVLGIPLANLVHKAGVLVAPVGDGWRRSWSLWKFSRIALGASWQFREEIAWSLLVSSVAATLAVALGAPLAWWACRRKLGGLVVLAVVALLLALPGPLIGLQVIGLLNQPSSPLLLWLYDRSIAAPVTAQAVRTLPLATLVCWYAFMSLSREPFEAAALDGAGRLDSFLRIALPQRKLALAGAWLVALATCLGDLSASILVVPPGLTTVSVRVFGLLHAGVDDQVSALCLNLAMGLIALGWISVYVLRRGLSGAREKSAACV